MKETEWKYLVPCTAFETLLKLARAVFGCEGKQTVQINYYYDTEKGDMGARGVTVRVRQTGMSLSGTVKRHGKGGVSEETAFAVERLPDKLCYEGKTLHLMGSLVTQRTVFTFDTCELCFDKNDYLGTEDYEIEVEWKNGKAPGDDIGGRDAHSKYARFLDVYGALRHEDGR